MRNHTVTIEIQFEFDTEDMDSAEKYGKERLEELVNTFALEKSRVLVGSVIEVSEA